MQLFNLYRNTNKILLNVAILIGILFYFIVWALSESSPKFQDTQYLLQGKDRQIEDQQADRQAGRKTNFHTNKNPADRWLDKQTK